MSSLLQARPEAACWHFRAGAASLRVAAPDLPAASTPPCAAEAALALDLAGPLLDALQAADLADADAWHWSGPPGQPGLAASGARGLWSSAPGQVQAIVTLPWPVLRALPQAPDVPGLQWQAAPAECLLAQWRFREDELAALEPGGLLLLDAPCTRARARSEPALPGDLPWQLVARWPAPVAVEALMGWTGPLPGLPVEALLVETSWPDAVLARGRLLPWGSGQALRIEAR